MSLTGDTVASYPTPLLEVKTDTHCSGISTFADPFAQIGAFWLSQWGKSVFDGLSPLYGFPQTRSEFFQLSYSRRRNAQRMTLLLSTAARLLR